MPIQVKDATGATQTVQTLDDVQKGSGPVTGTTQRVVLADNGPTVTTLASLDTKATANNASLASIDSKSEGAITAYQTAFVMNAVNDAVTVSVLPGAELSLATAVPNFVSGGTHTVAFEGWNGSAWVAISVRPKTIITGQAPVTTASAVGLWRYRVEAGITQVRIRLSAIATLTAVWAWIDSFTVGTKIHLPFVGLTSGTFGQATNNPCVPAINMDRLADITMDIQAFAGTSQTVTFQAGNDDAGVNWGGLVATAETTILSGTALTATAAGRYTMRPFAQYARVLLTYSALTSLSINGITSTVVAAQQVPITMAVQGLAAVGASTNLGNPFPAGIQTQTAALTTADGNNSLRNLTASPGRQALVRNGQIRAAQSQNSITLSTTTETTLLAAVASLFQDITELTIANTSATGVRVDLRSTTAGTVIFSVWVPPTTTLHLPWKTGLLQAAVNTNWTAQLSAAVTDIRITAVADRWVG